MKEKKLKYISVMYECSDELAEHIYSQFDTEENKDTFYSINILKTDEYWINFDYYFKPKYKKIVFINLQNIRLIYYKLIFNLWQKYVSMFDLVLDLYESNIKEYRPNIIAKYININLQNYKKEADDLYNVTYYLDDFSKKPKNTYHFTIGDHTGFNQTKVNIPTVGGEDRVFVGNYCSVGENVTFLVNREHDYNHVACGMLKLKFDDGYRKPPIKGDIKVGNDVWIGTNSLILSGKTISDGAVIGANSVVTKDVPPYAIVAGNPAKIVKYRFTQKQIEKLLKIKWWDWPVWKVYDNIDLIDSENVDEFIEKFYEE